MATSGQVSRPPAGTQMTITGQFLVAADTQLKQLRRENSELRRANEILKAASAFFARELDPRLPHS